MAWREAPASRSRVEDGGVLLNEEVECGVACPPQVLLHVALSTHGGGAGAEGAFQELQPRDGALEAEASLVLATTRRNALAFALSGAGSVTDQGAKSQDTIRCTRLV
eukprot:gene8119-9649_t